MKGKAIEGGEGERCDYPRKGGRDGGGMDGGLVHR